MTSAAVLNAGDACPEPSQQPFLVLQTGDRKIVIELNHEAAPRATAWIATLADGPLFHPDLTGAGLTSAKAESTGYYDQLTIDFAQPNIEIRTAVRQPASALLVRNQIDGHALGLHEDKIHTQIEADRLWQWEIVKAQNRNKRDPHYSAQIKEWLDQYHETSNPSFLIGVSRLEVNQAFGFDYVDELPSQPVTKGSVSLVPSPTKNLSTPGLSIALTDLPQRNGRWMVIGRVVEGLDVALEISKAPSSKDTHHRSFKPRQPVAIKQAQLECRETPSEKRGTP